MHEFEESPLTLSIDPTGSGFPHLRDVWFYNEDHARAEQELKPPRPRRHRGDGPPAHPAGRAAAARAGAQGAARLLPPAAAVAPPAGLPPGGAGGAQAEARKAPLPSGRLHRATAATTSSSSSRWSSSWWARPGCDGPWSSAAQDPSGRLRSSRPGCGRRHSSPSGTLARHLDSVPGLQPKLLKRYTFGPYHHEFTDEQGATRELLDEHGRHPVPLPCRDPHQPRRALRGQPAEARAGPRSRATAPPARCSARPSAPTS